MSLLQAGCLHPDAESSQQLRALLSTTVCPPLGRNQCRLGGIAGSLGTCRSSDFVGVAVDLDRDDVVQMTILAVIQPSLASSRSSRSKHFCHHSCHQFFLNLRENCTGII